MSISVCVNYFLMKVGYDGVNYIYAGEIKVSAVQSVGTDK